MWDEDLSGADGALEVEAAVMERCRITLTAPTPIGNATSGRVLSPYWFKPPRFG